MNREEWAKRPVAERIEGLLAAWDLVTGEDELPRGTSINPRSFALDLPDAPAQDGEMPWRDSLRELLDHACVDCTPNSTCPCAMISRARALLESKP